MVFHNGSNYDCHFIIKELAKEFKGEFYFLKEDTEEYKYRIQMLELPIKKFDKN